MIQARKKEEYSDLASIRVLAYDALMTYGINNLPVDPGGAIHTLKHVEVRPITYCKEIVKDIPPYVLKEVGNGFVVYSKAEGIYYIVYNPDSTEEDLRWFFTTAIASVRIGNIKYGMGQDFYIDGTEKDPESEEFAYHFLAPDPVLMKCDISTAAEIMKYCKIPFAKAHKKARYLKRLSEKTYLIKYAAEDLLVSYFAGYIKSKS